MPAWPESWSNVWSGELHDHVDSPVACHADRKLEVFQLIGRGLKTRKIAEKLALSVKTVESYRTHIKEKLRIDNGIQLLQRAVQWVES